MLWIANAHGRCLSDDGVDDDGVLEVAKRLKRCYRAARSIGADGRGAMEGTVAAWWLSHSRVFGVGEIATLMLLWVCWACLGEIGLCIGRRKMTWRRRWTDYFYEQAPEGRAGCTDEERGQGCLAVPPRAGSVARRRGS